MLYSSDIYCILLIYDICLLTTPISYAGDGKSDRAKLDSVTISPDPPVKGQDVTVEATVTLSM